MLQSNAQYRRRRGAPPAATRVQAALVPQARPDATTAMVAVALETRRSCPEATMNGARLKIRLSSSGIADATNSLSPHEPGGFGTAGNLVRMNSAALSGASRTLPGPLRT
jgi:hypothetical protein